MTNKVGKKPKVTMGICVKNSEKTIKETIDSIIRQKYPNQLMEMIIVDGGSKDKTLSIVMSTVSKIDIPLRIYFDEGGGLGVARQMVVDNAFGEYLIFVDSDVALSKDFAQKEVEFMEKNPKVGIDVGKFLYKEGTLVANLQNLHRYITSNEFVDNDVIGYGAIYGAYICRIEALKEVGGFDKNIKGAGEDVDIMIRIKARGWSLSANEKATFYARAQETWRDVWIEQVWFGYGSHFISHKHKGLFTLWRKAPLVSFVGGWNFSMKAYKLMRQRKSFLIPLLFVFRRICWWFGFIRSHADGYGHKNNLISKVATTI